MERGPQPCVRGGGAAKQAIITMQEDGFQTRCPCFLHCQRCTQLIPDGMLDDQWFHGAQEGRQPLPGFVHFDAAGTQHLQWGGRREQTMQRYQAEAKATTGFGSPRPVLVHGPREDQPRVDRQ